MRTPRTSLTLAAGAVTLAIPVADAAAAAAKAKAPKAKTKVTTLTKSFTGQPGSADRWGDVEVTIVVKKTTTTNLKTHKKTVARRIASMTVPVYPNHTDRSIFINQQALPMLVQETLQAQSTGIQMISGATYTSQGFQQSLQSAILAAKAW